LEAKNSGKCSDTKHMKKVVNFRHYTTRNFMINICHVGSEV